MSNITQKEMFEVVKYFKLLYSSIKYKEEIIVYNDSLYFEADQYSILFGKLKQHDNEFSKWVSKGKTFIMTVSDINLLRGCLKKNVESIEISDSEFKFTYKDRDGNTMVFLCSDMGKEAIPPIMKKTEAIKKSLGASKPVETTNRDLLEIYLTEENVLTEERTSDKIIEIPIPKIVSLLKDSQLLLSYSEKDEEGSRFVGLTSENNLVSLTQLFVTI